MAQATRMAGAEADLPSKAGRPDMAAFPQISASTAGQPPKGFRPEATNDDKAADKNVLRDVRVLIVEDEFLVAIQLEDTLSSLGCKVLEPAHSLDGAQKAVDDNQFDVAVLDINIAGDPVYPIAQRLADAGIPFVFTTGYSREHIEEPWRNRPTLRKPYLAVELRRALEEVLTAGE